MNTNEEQKKSARPVVKRPEGDSTTGDVARREEEMLAFWNEHDVFNKSIETPAGKEPVGDFVFYDGPPFATGLPHYGHILAGTIKDAVPRFWTMNGYRVRRKWGWDCHGLPLENLIEKKLGLATKRDIEEYGVKNFNEAARDAVLEFRDDWREIIPRMGRWADMDDDYRTMDSTYTESVWWVFKSLHEKGLVYEGFKGMHLCPRCGTTLSNFEVNQGYKDIKDIAVTVKLPLLDDAGEVTDTSLLVWTTTPWTLPGNMAAAVNNEHEYAKVKVTTDDGEEIVVLAKERIAQLDTEDHEILETFKGSELVGKSYKPPFSYHQDREFENKGNAWKIYHADYVELGEEGTGAVHLAPAYGEEDMELAKVEGIPIVHHVDSDGHFMDFVTDFAGQLVKPKDDDDAGVTHLDADIEIVKALKANDTLFRKENITHSYPHCWRCDTPLLNYATTSWFVEVTKIRDELVAENNKVKWVPEHVGKNRFGKWLENARDWAVSRQRYWGAPLPIWRNPVTKEYKVFGSLSELQEYVPKSGNTYFTMRHGESTKNTQALVTNAYDAPYPLTEKGIGDVKKTAKELMGKVDLIITSPVLRAKETAELVATEIGMSVDEVIIDERIRETEHGVYEGRPLSEYREQYGAGIHKFEAKPEGGENWSDLRARVGDFMYELEKKYHDKRILIVSHGDPLTMLHASVAGLSKEDTVATYSDAYPEKGVARELSFTPMPHNDIYALDFHRPYIDDFAVFEDGVQLERVPDVFDCWFESGSMPYAETHYPFDPSSRAEGGSAHYGAGNLDDDKLYPVRFPADFISEAVDQTRGWFYSLMVLGVALFGKSPFQNVITNGLVLAEDGKKMSKKLQNYPDPVELVERQGADSMRFYLLSSPIIKGEDLNFSEKEVQELQRKNIGRLHNVLAMYEQYAGDEKAHADSLHVLDRWILARLYELISEATEGFKNYELDRATRPITDFIDDLSVWYLRRSRDRLKGDDAEDKQATLATLKYVLQNLALVMAPSMPFYAEYLWSRVKETDGALSVHLGVWPKAESVDRGVLDSMAKTREMVSLALEQRAKANIKVRQPLLKLRVHDVLPHEYLVLVTDEVNVKEIVVDVSMEETVMLDLSITEELKAEGDAREFMRQVQDMRKQAGLLPHDRISLTVQTSDGGEALVTQFLSEIKKTVGADDITFGDATGTEVKAGDHECTVELKKVS